MQAICISHPTIMELQNLPASASLAHPAFAPLRELLQSMRDTPDYADWPASSLAVPATALEAFAAEEHTCLLLVDLPPSASSLVPLWLANPPMPFSYDGDFSMPQPCLRFTAATGELLDVDIGQLQEQLYKNKCVERLLFLFAVGDVIHSASMEANALADDAFASELKEAFELNGIIRSEMLHKERREPGYIDFEVSVRDFYTVPGPGCARYVPEVRVLEST